MTLARHLSRAVALLVLAAVPSQAQWNLSADFSSVSNPNGVWSFGSRTNADLLGTGLNVFTASGSSFGWDQTWSSVGLPNVSKNVSGTTQSFSSIVNVPAGQVYLHPGPSGDLAIVRFTAPQSGMYQYTSLFRGQDCCATSTDVHVLQNGSTQLFGALVNGYLATQTSSNTVSLSAGNTLEFVVGWGQNSNYGFDTTALDVDIDFVVTATPEPASMVLLATGLLGVFGLARRRRS